LFFINIFFKENQCEKLLFCIYYAYNMYAQTFLLPQLSGASDMNLKNNGKVVMLLIVIALFIVAGFNIYNSSGKKEGNQIPISSFMKKVADGKIKKVDIKDQDISGVDHSGQAFSTYAPHGFNVTPLLLEKGVEEVNGIKEEPSLFFSWLHILFPLVFLGSLWFFFMRQVQSSNGRAVGFGRSRAKMSDPEKNTIKFSDVEGIEEAKEDLKEIVDFLENPQRFRKIGGRIPRGVLLVGPPGTGKTLLAKAVAGEAGVPFFSISGSDFVEMFVGVGASRVRDLFAQAKQHAPAIIFIDEVDAVGRHRGSGIGGGNDEREQTLNQLLVELDGFEDKDEVIVIAATNRADVLDPAFLRPGRFDRRIFVSLPDIKGREKILNVHLRKVKTATDISISALAKSTPGFSGADLANLVNESALLAARNHKKEVEMEDFESSRDKLLMGPEHRSRVFTESDRKLTAYHEAGHAVVAYYSPMSDPIHKATILSRGMALGVVMRFPAIDRFSVSKTELLTDLAVAMGGRVAEEITFGSDLITTGAQSDLESATRIARKMVLEWGMSDSVGPIHYTSGSSRNISEDMMRLTDSEIKKLLEKAYIDAKTILTKYEKDFILIAESLLEHETLTGDDIHCLITEGSLSLTNRKPKKSNKKSSKIDLEKDPQETGIMVSPPSLAVD
jgi:cell division protease FtsH